MPYTPPAQRSPAVSGFTSPVGNGQELHERPASPQRLHSPDSSRPALPRSNNSAAYLRRPRRSSSFHTLDQRSPVHITALNTAQNTPTQYDSLKAAATSSVRQSPPPVSDAAMPPGAYLSPPDSAQNSSDDESQSPVDEERRVEGFSELQDAVRRSLEIDKAPSPPDGDREAADSSSDKKIQLTVDIGKAVAASDDDAVRPRLTPEARRISHSRSATESSFFEIRGTQSLNTSQATSDDSDEDLDPSYSKPPLLRKKSGELVKPAIRPSSRRKHSSMPGTPTYSKAVHFNEDIEQVRHFLQVDRPIAVSAGTSPVEAYEDESEFPFGRSHDQTSWELRLANFPRDSLERQALPARVESIALAADQKSINGSIAVANLAFHKHVVARFTLDYWKTTSEIVAEYNNDTRQQKREDGYDQFKFNIKLFDQANLASKTLLLCVRYNVNGQEYWDNNDSMNFQVDFIRNVKPQPQHQRSQSAGLGARPIPRSRRNSSTSPRPRSIPSFDDDFSKDFDSNTTLRFKAKPAPNPNPISLGTTPPRQKPSVSQPFASRYDFGASLSAALSQAQLQLGERSGIKPKGPAAATPAPTPAGAPAAPQAQPSSSQLPVRTGIAASNSGADSPRPDALLANKQSLDSRAYQEFVSKFCFFGSAKATPVATFDSSKRSAATDMDGTNDDATPSSGAYTTAKRGTASPQSGDYFPTSGGSHTLLPSALNDVRSSSPTPFAGQEISGRSSPVSFGYPYIREQKGIFNSEPATPQAIQG